MLETFHVLEESLLGGAFFAQTKKIGYISADDFLVWAWAIRTASVPNLVNRDFIFGAGFIPW